mmetsp:Transcript_1597/g.2189  ORF Transcript_1597/g.2189 Transcript_1597/m.2189 type:complete len:862 (+) Transcript_1597:203-2788(+)
MAEFVDIKTDGQSKVVFGDSFPENVDEFECQAVDMLVSIAGLCRMVEECSHEVKCNRRKCHHLSKAISEIPEQLQILENEAEDHLDEGDLRHLYQLIQGACDLIQDFGLKNKNDVNRVLFAKEARVSFLHIEKQLEDQVTAIKNHVYANQPEKQTRGRSESQGGVNMMRVQSIEADRTEVWSVLKESSSQAEFHYMPPAKVQGVDSSRESSVSESEKDGKAGKSKGHARPPRSPFRSDQPKVMQDGQAAGEEGFATSEEPASAAFGPETTLPQPWWVDYRHLVFDKTPDGKRMLLGVGRCGKVYLATYFGTKVAVKEPHNNSDLSQEAIAEFEKEIDESYRMRHRNLVSILGGGTFYNNMETNPPTKVTQCFIVMEYLPDRSLAELLFSQPRKTLNSHEIASIAFGVCAALVYLHGHNPPVVHKAIRPENILLGSHLEPKLVDLALPRVESMDTMYISLKNGHGPRTFVQGSVEWMAPEEYEGKYSTKSDVYSFGLILIAMYSNKDPFDTSKYSLEDLMSSIGSGLLAPEIPPNIPIESREFILACTHLDPERRPDIIDVMQFCEARCFEAHENPYYLNILHRQPTLGELQETNLEQRTLCNLYHKAGGRLWEIKDNWLQSEDLSTWYGVVMENENVHKLLLSENDMSGLLPRSICNFMMLDTLDLSFNNLSGFIPEEVGSLDNLRVLHLNDNRFSGPIPRSLSKLTKLERCVLSWNDLTGIIPSSLGNISSLVVLYLCGNKLSGPVPPSLGNLTNLQALSLHSNKFQGNIKEIGLHALTNLTSLDLSSNKFEGEIPENLGDLVELHKLHLNQNLFTGEVPADLWKLHKLKQLYLNGNMLTDTIAAAAWLQEQLPSCNIRS